MCAVKFLVQPTYLNLIKHFFFFLVRAPCSDWKLFTTLSFMHAVYVQILILSLYLSLSVMKLLLFLLRSLLSLSLSLVYYFLLLPYYSPFIIFSFFLSLPSLFTNPPIHLLLPRSVKILSGIGVCLCVYGCLSMCIVG